MTVAAWGSCPECGGAIAETMASCKECGFPLKAVPKPAAPPPPPATSARTTRRSIIRTGRRRAGKGRPILEPGEEPPSAMLFAVFGLVVPILAFLALALSKRGSGAYKFAWVGIGLWIAALLFVLSRAFS